MSKKRSPVADEWKGIPHSRIRHEVTDSPAWRVLSWPARALYTDLRGKMRSFNNGNINATLSEMKHRGWTSSATLTRALRQLEWMGFIAKTRQGGIASLSKVCSLYRFTDMWVYEQRKPGIPEIAPTFDYRRFESVKDARAAMRELEARENSKVRELKLLGSGNESMGASIASGDEQVTSPQLQEVNKGETPKPRATSGRKVG